MKGYMYTIEVMIAISIIFVTLAFVFRSSPSIPSADTSFVKIQVYNFLDYYSDFIREKVSVNDEESIENLLKEFNSAFSYKAKICIKGLPCTETLPDNITITSLDYYIFSGDSGKKLKIWVWGFDA